MTWRSSERYLLTTFSFIESSKLFPPATGFHFHRAQRYVGSPVGRAHRVRTQRALLVANARRVSVVRSLLARLVKTANFSAAFDVGARDGDVKFG